jgi:hypothetical protein
MPRRSRLRVACDWPSKKQRHDGTELDSGGHSLASHC